MRNYTNFQNQSESKSIEFQQLEMMTQWLLIIIFAYEKYTELIDGCLCGWTAHDYSGEVPDANITDGGTGHRMVKIL